MPIWDVSTVLSTGNCSLSPLSGARGLYFKPDGTKFYMLSRTTNSVYQFGMTTPWDVTTASYDSVSVSVDVETNQPEALWFRDNGLKMYVVASDPDFLYQYSLSSAWDLSTVSYDSVSFNVGTQDGGTTGLYIRADGAKVFTCGQFNDNVYRYSLGTAWSVASMSYDSNSKSIPQDASPGGISFKDDGTKMFMIGSNSDSIFQYTLATGWDLSTATYDSVFLAAGHTSTDLHFKPDGTIVYVLSQLDNRVYQYVVGTLGGWTVGSIRRST